MKTAEIVEVIVGKLVKKEALTNLDVRTHLERCFKRVPNEKKQSDAESWLAWARGQQHVKVISADIPPQVLPPGVRGCLQDVKVHSRGPDDAIYDKYQDVREKVARGNCFIKVQKTGDGEAGAGAGAEESATSCIVYGLKKFTGGLGDDDDRGQGDNHIWKRYFTKPLESSTHVVCTRKANGEAGHLAAKRIAGNVYLCAGSKNVHLLFRNKDDLKYYTESRYRIALEVATAILTLVNNMDAHQRELLLSFLCGTSFTGIFEVLQPTYQHVEDLSHLSGPEVRFITWTTSDLDPSANSSLCSMPPHLAIEVAASLGLPTVAYDVIAFSAVDARMVHVREGYQYEGEVLYFIDANSDVIGLLKKKTIWYIVCRAIREKVRVACGQQAKEPSKFSPGVAIKKIEKRLREIQSWLGLDEDSTKSWTELGVGYLKWTLRRLDSGEVDFQQVAEMFPVQWKKYLEESGQTDKIASRWKEPEGSDK